MATSPLFHPKSLIEAQHQAVGDCKGLTMQQRWDEETPVFAKAILSHLPQIGLGPHGINQILDYGCGPGRLAKEILLQADNTNHDIVVWGADNSPEMLMQANEYVGSISPFETTSGAFIDRFSTVEPQGMAQFSQHFDLCYLVYCLQHMPAIEIRDALRRIWTSLVDNGLLFYCSSENRMAMRSDEQGFFDDRFLGVDLKSELSRFFEEIGPAIPDELMNDAVRHMTTGDHAHPATLYRKKTITGHLFNAMPDNPIPEVVLPKVGQCLPELNTCGEWGDEAPSKKQEPHTCGETTRISDPAPTTRRQLPKVPDNATIVAESVGEPVIKPESHVRQSNADARAGSPTKLILQHRLSPGDILVMSAAIRALHTAYPGEYLTDVRSPCNAIYANSPYITPLNEGDPDVRTIDMQYPEIHKSGMSGLHFADGMRLYLAEQIGRPIPTNGIQPEIFLTPAEKKLSVVKNATGIDPGPYVVIDAGVKTDYSLKQYHYYQEVVDLLDKEHIQCIQVGVKAPSHIHPELEGVIDMVGKTDDHRQFFALIDQADVVITPVSYPMHIAAALRKPCVVVALGREAPRWEYYPDHQYLTVNGCLDCCRYDGCWKNRLEDCVDLVDGIPHCNSLIEPKDIASAVMRYYKGNVIRPKSKEVDRKQVRIPNEVIINTLRILKQHNPEDMYLENYMGHIRKRGDDFYDIYHFIWEWVPQHYPRNVLEIGTWTGNSLAQLLCAYMDYSNLGHIVTCDLFDQPQSSPEQVRASLQSLNIPQDVIDRIQFLEGDSHQLVPQFYAANPEVKFDWILIDGAHYPPELPRQDLENVAPMVAMGGVLVMDDLAPDGMSLQPVWEEFKAQHQDEFEWFENYDGKGIGYAIRK